MGFTDFINDAWSWTKGAGNDIWNDAVKPAWNKITNVGGKVIDVTEKFGENTLTNISNMQGLISNPVVVIAVIMGAIIVIPPLIQKIQV